MDSQPMLEGLRRTIAEASGQLTDGVARVIGDAPPDRLDRLMDRAPIRRAVLEAIFWQMPKRLDRTRAGQISGSVRWCVTGGPGDRTDVYQLELANGSATVIRGDRATDPKVTITLDGAEFLRLATGNSDAMQAYFKGRILLAGDIMFAARLISLFKIPARKGAGSA